MMHYPPFYSHRARRAARNCRPALARWIVAQTALRYARRLPEQQAEAVQLVQGLHQLHREIYQVSQVPPARLRIWNAMPLTELRSLLARYQARRARQLQQGA
jgi:hypothetical protein